MKLVLFTRAGGVPTAGALTPDGVQPFANFTGATALMDLIAHSGEARPDANVLRLSEVHLLAPLPRPGKILCSTATYGQTATERPQLLLTLKSAESVIGPDDTVRLPDVGSNWTFAPEAELGLVMRGPSKSVKADDWRKAVFGYTVVIDVMAQGDQQFGRDFWLAKSDTLGPLGPCIVTADEVPDPQQLQVSSSINGQPAQRYAMADADYRIGEQVELATTIMTLHVGDILACGTSPEGLRPLADGDTVQVQITGVGELNVRVASPVGARI